MLHQGDSPGVPHAPRTRDAVGHLDAAVRVAARARGHVEPNPQVGCTITDAAGRRIAVAAHRKFGEAHAEVEALRIAGAAARGATAWVTLEPCDHHGKQPPCTGALIQSGIARVVFAVADPNPDAAGGAARLLEAGIEVEHAPWHGPSRRLVAPFIHRIRTGRPWVIAKWAQTIDGWIATRSGHSQWISGPRSRRAVHRERGRADVILTGLGTVLADDPRLDPRDVRLRRRPTRVVIDPEFQTPVDGRLVASAGPPTHGGSGPVVIAGDGEALARGGAPIDRLRAAGVELMGLPPRGSGVDLGHLLGLLGARGAARVIVESGATLLGSLLADDLVQESWVFTGPRMLADAQGLPPATGAAPERIDAGVPMHLVDLRRRGVDVMARWLTGSAAVAEASIDGAIG